jgi:glycosyltransferase involved in cell wall biosynthesis
MAALAHGCALVTTTGALTETVWAETRAAALAPVGDAETLAADAASLLAAPAARAALATRGRNLYMERFDLRHTIAALRGRL